MSIDKLFSSLKDVEVSLNKDLSKYTTMRLKAFGDLIEVRTVDALKDVLKLLNNNKIQYIILGMGANQLLKEESDVPYLKINLDFNKEYLDEIRDSYLLPASVKLSLLTSCASKHGLRGWEVFTGIPATLGGATFMNAGTGLGEIGEVINKVWMITHDGREKVIEINENSFKYRGNNFVDNGDIIYQVELGHKGIDPKVTEVIRNYLAKRNASQPMSENTCGCVFKNHKYNELSCPAGKFIDIIGLKGLQVGGIRVSEKHGNFMENFSDANYEDVKNLISLVVDEIELQTGIRYELEAKV